MSKYKINNVWRLTLLKLKRIPEKNLLVIIAVIIGIVSGLTVFIFEGIVEGIRTLLYDYQGINGINFLYFTLPVVGIILVTVFVKGIIKEPIGHGVTRVIKAISHNKAVIKPHNMYSSAVSGAVTIGFGGSVGPEAPIVMTGSAIGSNIAQFFRLGHRSTTILLACGAASAVAAIFKAPITGVVFVLEILLIDMTMSSIIPILIAAATSTSLIYGLHGFEPVFKIAFDDTPISISNIPFYTILAVFCGLSAHWIIFSSSRIEAMFKSIKHQYYKWAIGSIAIASLIFLFPPLYGQGYNSINDVLAGDISNIFRNSIFTEYVGNEAAVLLFLAFIIFTKPIAMACTNAAGGVGGVFAPSLFIGAFVGYFTASALNLIFDMELPVVAFTLVGMAGVMSGAMDSPLTAIFLIAEITGGYKLFLPLMLVSAISFGISYYFSPFSVYTRELVLEGDSLSLSSDRSMIYLDLPKLIEDNFLTVQPDTPLESIVDTVKESHRNLFPVLSPNGEFVGYFTLDSIRNDMFERELYTQKFASDYMKSPKQIIKITDNISMVLDKFDLSGAWNLPVVDQDDKYLGFVSKSNIFSEYRNEQSNS